MEKTLKKIILFFAYRYGSTINTYVSVREVNVGFTRWTAEKFIINTNKTLEITKLQSCST